MLCGLIVRKWYKERIEINPLSLEMGFTLAPASPDMIADVARGLEPGKGSIVPAEAAMAPSPAIIIFNEVLAMIHENDCSQIEVQLQSSKDWRQLKVSDRWVASSVVKLLEQEEQLCRECGYYPSKDQTVS